MLNKLKKHQLARVLRVDKMTLAALEATVKSYIQGNHKQIPTIGDLITPLSKIKEKVEIFISQIDTEALISWKWEIRKDTTQIGGGTMPGVEIPTFAVALTHSRYTSNRVFELLRVGHPSIITRLKKKMYLLIFVQ
ncbi:L-seryl-tRNA(Ser) seleniumtransferase [Alteribacillus bidgolensis]|uniref:L-seryl-tRNA(Ser) seleniumtransferase n=1 Tax=Alteribacillus bidgolensis TaxID=930129 RepID=A0A1G8K2A5_9BACI|nr:L-seryl-tRNA(Ser) seleniumtransferase [Alteribacillus bidgolensis]